MGQRPNVPGLTKFPDRPPTPTAHTHTCTNTQDRLCGPAHRVLHSSALCPDEGVSDKGPNRRAGARSAETACVVCFSLFDFQGAEHLLIHTIEQPEYCHFKLHNSEKRVVFPSYLHTYIHILTILTYLKMRYSV